MTALRAIIWLAVSTTAQAAEDKASLARQEADALAACTAHGWRVVDTLRVEGHSRAYIDIHDAAAAMREEGIDAFDKLLRHWQARDFDVLVCRDGSRFARTQSLHAYVIERTISIGASIFLTDGGGMVTAENQRGLISVTGFMAAGEIDTLRKRKKLGVETLARRGLPSNGKVCESHRIIRDPSNGKMVGIELDTTRAQEWRHLAELLLEGIPYRQMAHEMRLRYGYCNPLGLEHNETHYFQLLHTPAFWGHLAVRRKGKKLGPWVWDENEPLPDGVTLYRDSHAPVYTGDLAERVKAEMRRRAVLRGNGRPRYVKRFTGLFFCKECGWSLAYDVQRQGQKRTRWLKCASRYVASHNTQCGQRRMMREEKAAAAIRALLVRAQQYGLIALDLSEDNPAAKAEELQRVTDSIQQAEMQIRRLIHKQTAVDESLSYMYDEQINAEATRLKALRAQQQALKSVLAEADNPQQQEAQEELQQMDIDALLAADERWLNQFLHRLLGKRRLYVQDGEVVGIGIPPRRGKRY